jgi:peroxiredoxin
MGSSDCPFFIKHGVKYHTRKEDTMKLYVGQAAPDFSLPSHLDKDIKLSDYLGKNVVLVFFPLAWTPV